MGTSWRTTMFGIISGLMIVLAEAITAFDSDPKTNPSIPEIFAGFALMGLGSTARDNGVTSEQAGIKR